MKITSQICAKIKVGEETINKSGIGIGIIYVGCKNFNAIPRDFNVVVGCQMYSIQIIIMSKLKIPRSCNPTESTNIKVYTRESLEGRQRRGV